MRRLHMPRKINFERLGWAKAVCAVSTHRQCRTVDATKITAVLLTLWSSTEVGLLVNVTMSAVFAASVACSLRMTV